MSPIFQLQKHLDDTTAVLDQPVVAVDPGAQSELEPIAGTDTERFAAPKSGRVHPA